MSTVPATAQIGHVERALTALYRRHGTRLISGCIVVSSLLAVIAGAISMTILERFIGLSVGQALATFAIWMPIVLASALLGVPRSRRQLLTLRAWGAGARTRQSAPDTWYAVIRVRRVVTRCLAIGLIAIPGLALYVVLEYHKPWYGLVGFTVGAGLGAVNVWILIIYGAELMLRPMLIEVAAWLPSGFEPRADGRGLRTRMVAALPVVTFLAAMLVGAYGNGSNNGTDRLALAVGVSVVSVAIATVAFLVINRSALAPIDDLIAATRRVREGDIATPVPLVSADELGALAHSFNEMLSELRSQTAELQSSRERLAAAADAERRRVERELHDGAQRPIVQLEIELRGLQASLAPGSDAAVMATEIGEDLRQALRELRDLARGIYPPLLEQGGLPAALSEAARRSALPAELRCEALARYPSKLEAAVYFCCLEALQNAAKYAGQRARATISLADHDGVLRFAVADDGAGFDILSATASAGLQNMTDRIGALGGELRIDSAPGRGTSVSGSVPLRS